MTPENFIVRTFYENYIKPIDPSILLQTYWKFIRDCIVIIEKSDIYFDWLKYNDARSWFTGNNYYIKSIDFARWLDIYLNYKDEDES